jgi:hypothetical protein
MSCGNSLFGPVNQYIKTNTGDFVAVEGSSTRERLSLSDLRLPYKQLIKGRVILKPGQTDYLLNHLGLGDNATFLLLKATYDSKSVFEKDNYIQWNFYDDFSKKYPMSNLLILTGNSISRIQQIYLSNPNVNYSVTIDVMVSLIDDNTSAFKDVVNQSGLSFNNLQYTSIRTHIVNESIVIYGNDFPPVPICYLTIADITTISKNGKILIIDDLSVGSIYLDFKSNYDADQAFSLIEWVINTPGAVIQDLEPLNDGLDPLLKFSSLVYLIGSTYSSPYDSSMGITFSATMSFAQYATASGTKITKDILIDELITEVFDVRDSTMALNNGSILIYDINDNNLNDIMQLGTYSIHFDIVDNASNAIDSNKNIQLRII